MKKIYIIAIIIFFTFLVIYFVFLRKDNENLKWMKVSRGDVLQEVSETGQVRKGEEFNLFFKTGGRIEKIYVKEGDKVKANDILAEVDNSQLFFQLKQAEANLELAQANFKKLISGATPQEIQIVKTELENAKTALEIAKQSLQDTDDTTKENLKIAHENALNFLDDSYLKIFNAFNVVDNIQKNYFFYNDQESIKVKESKEIIFNSLSKIKSSLDLAKNTQENEKIENTLSLTKVELQKVSEALRIIRETCQEGNYQTIVSLTDKTYLDNQRSYINTALTNIVNSQQNIATIKIANSTNINIAQGKVETSEGQLKIAQEKLNKITSPPRQEDIDFYQAQIKQAEAQIYLIKNQIGDTKLLSPVNGEIIRVNKKIGETVQSVGDLPVIVLLPEKPFEVKVNIYEEDVVKIKVGNPVEISLVSFPEKTFSGKVRSIDPAAKVINGVIYYETIVDFDEVLENLKPGMTADLVIKTAFKENVLTLPTDAIKKKDGKLIVEVLKNGKIEEREIQIGLKGSQGLSEVISGLIEGEKVIIR